MYAHIEGTVSEKNADSIVIDAGGVGYEISASATTPVETSSDSMDVPGRTTDE